MTASEEGDKRANLFRQPRVRRTLGSIETSRGDIVMLVTESPNVMRPDWFLTYVGLAEWLPSRAPVAMFVTAIFLPSGTREGNLVFAPAPLRYDAVLDGPNPSIPVQVGRWLFDGGWLTHHSVDRTASGDRWAKAVGGILPPLANEHDPSRGNREATERDAVHAYEALCKTDWSRWLRPGQSTGAP